MKKYICHANNNHNRAGVATPPDKIDSKTKQKKMLLEIKKGIL